mgnify:CR=1 FL=1
MAAHSRKRAASSCGTSPNTLIAYSPYPSAILSVPCQQYTTAPGGVHSFFEKVFEFETLFPPGPVARRGESLYSKSKESGPPAGETKGGKRNEACRDKRHHPARHHPYGPDEEVNLEELRRQVERLLESGVHGIFCFGTNGEGYALDGGEKRQILKAAVSQVRGRVPVYAGTGCVTTRETIAQSRMACEEGADVLSIVTPSFGAASQQELYDHYAAVARAVDLPILLTTSLPARGIPFCPRQWRGWPSLPNIVGIKDSSGDWNSMLAYLEIGKAGTSRSSPATTD